MRVVPNAAILFISYEVIINVLRKWGQPKDHQGLSDQVGVMTRPPPQHLPVVRKVQSSTSADDSLNAAENAGESKDL